LKAKEAARLAALSPATKAERIETLKDLIQLAGFIDGGRDCSRWHRRSFDRRDLVDAMKHVTPPTAEIPLSDRLPTFHELASFDAAAAWDGLSPEQQCQIGMLALRFGTIGQCEGFYHTTLQGVRKGSKSSHWTPAAQITAVWPRLQIDLVESAGSAAFQALCEHLDPVWPQLFGWAPGKEVKRQP
jgi:hypothetical protein